MRTQEHSATERVLDSDFDDETKTVLLMALAGSRCPDCRQEAGDVLRDLGLM